MNKEKFYSEAYLGTYAAKLDMYGFTSCLHVH